MAEQARTRDREQCGADGCVASPVGCVDFARGGGGGHNGGAGGWSDLGCEADDWLRCFPARSHRFQWRENDEDLDRQCVRPDPAGNLERCSRGHSPVRAEGAGVTSQWKNAGCARAGSAGLPESAVCGCRGDRSGIREGRRDRPYGEGPADDDEFHLADVTVHIERRNIGGMLVRGLDGLATGDERLRKLSAQRKFPGPLVAMVVALSGGGVAVGGPEDFSGGVMVAVSAIKSPSLFVGGFADDGGAPVCRSRVELEGEERERARRPRNGGRHRWRRGK